jgi:hypothetical protein
MCATSSGRRSDRLHHANAASAIALDMLLEIPATGLPWRGSKDTLDRLIAATSAWLVQSFMPDVGQGGAASRRRQGPRSRDYADRLCRASPRLGLSFHSVRSSWASRSRRRSKYSAMGEENSKSDRKKRIIQSRHSKSKHRVESHSLLPSSVVPQEGKEPRQQWR